MGEQQDNVSQTYAGWGRVVRYKDIIDISMDEKGESPAKKRPSLTVEDFKLRHRLGRGAYGDVFLVEKLSDGKVYAMKQIMKKKLGREQKEYQAMVEKELLTCFKHRGIVSLKYAFQDAKMLYFVQEYCSGGDFTSFIKLNLNKLTQDVKVFYIAEIVNILQYLHTNGVTHRDLKPENLMLDRKGHLKLIDFGTAEITNCTLLTAQFKEHILKLKKKADEGEVAREKVEEEEAEEESPLKKRRSTFVGTCYYISPELLEQNYCPPSADLWALGCIMYQLYYLETPFKDNYEFAVFEKIKKAEVSYPKNESVTDEAIDLIKRLLVKDPAERLGSGSREELSYANLKAHPYFKGLDMDNIFNQQVPYIPDLQQPQKSEQDKAEYQLEYKSFSEKVEGLLKELRDSGRQIVKSSIVEEKSFVVYSYALLVLTDGGELHYATYDEPTLRQLNVSVREGRWVRLFSEDKLEVFTEERVLHMRCSSAEEWVAAITAHVKPPH